MAVPRVLCGISFLLTDLIHYIPEKEALSPPCTAVPLRVWWCKGEHGARQPPHALAAGYSWGTARLRLSAGFWMLCATIDICFCLLPALTPASCRGLVLPFSCTSQLRQNGGSGGMNHYHSLSLLKLERNGFFCEKL